MSGNSCKDQEKFQQLQAVIDAKKGTKGALMPVMQEAQAIFGYLPKEVQQFIADGLGVTLMVDMHVPEEELVRRILLRGKDSGRADDASEDVIRNRIKVYREQTEVVGAYYARQNKYFEVDGVGSMDEVFDRICRVVDAHR